MARPSEPGLLPPSVPALVRGAFERAGIGLPEDLVVDSLPPSVDGAGGDPTRAPSDAAEILAMAHRLGADYEALLDHDARSLGAHYTPLDVATRLAEVALDGVARGDAGPAAAAHPTVWDPACGGGAFLIAAAEVLRRAGFAPDRIVGELIWGTDIDPGAVAVTRAALVLWATLHGAAHARPANVSVADGLGGDVPRPGAGFRYVLGNPPFQGQLSGATVRSARARAALRERWGALVGAYTDTAALFLAAGLDALGEGGRLAMVLPTSVLAARDAGPVRDHVDRVAHLTGLWVAGEPVFDAAVHVWAPVLTRRGLGVDAAPVRRWRGRRFETLEPVERRKQRWSVLALAAHDVPVPVHRRGRATLADVAEASSSFRDEYYGLAPHVSELAPDRAAPGAGEHLRPLVTSGAIDPGRCLWGERPIRFNKATYRRPVVDEGSLAEAARGPDRAARAAARALAWARCTDRPKVVVATQTRVGEAAVDEDGAWLPSTPVIALLPLPQSDVIPGDDEADRLWSLAAVVCSPLGTVLALADSFGSARTPDAIKPTAASVLDLPLPADPEAWAEGAAALRRHAREPFAAAMARAYGIRARDASELERWWTRRARW